MTAPDFFHVDVFATRLLTGNGLTVFLCKEEWSATAMQRLTREMKQFESIFLSQVTATGARARVFTVDEELPFAGHPVLGAAAVLHRLWAPKDKTCAWTLELPSGEVRVNTRQMDSHYLAEMDQGAAILGDAIKSTDLQPVLASLGLDFRDLAAALPAQVISTGLPYLVLPVRPEALARAAINGSGLETLLAALGAKFVLLFDILGREVRTWDNFGRVEDVATGSAAGPAAAYLYEHRLADPASPITLAQGRFAGRPSNILIARTLSNRLLVSGEVWPVSRGVLDLDAMQAGCQDPLAIHSSASRFAARRDSRH